MRLHYTERLQSLRTQVVGMGLSASDMVRKASESIILGDPTLANEVVREDDELDRLEHELMMEAAMMMMQEGPVASDLKFLVSTLGVVSEIEKVADHAVKLARRGTKIGAHFPSGLKVTLRDLSDAARQQFTNSLKLYAEYDSDLATAIIVDDDLIDSRYTVARDKVLDLIREDSSAAGQMVRTIEIFHALEHVADHAVAIAKRIQLIHIPPGILADQTPEPESINEDFS